MLAVRTTALLITAHAAACVAPLDGLEVMTRREPEAQLDGGTLGAPDARAPAPDAGGLDSGCDECEISASIDGVRFEMPCHSVANPDYYVCNTFAAKVVMTELKGAPGAQYEIDLRFIGVIEERSYNGGTPIGAHLLLNPASPGTDDPWNAYQLVISDPPATYALNRGASGSYYVVPLDDRLSIVAKAGARFALTGVTYDRREIMNADAMHRPILPPELGPVPYDGQVIEVRVEGIRRLPR